VDRNRLKRLIRESFRHSSVRPLPFDLVIVAKSNATAASGDALRRSLERRWSSLVMFAERLHRQPQC
jgi:ribonuclease P protein component